MGSYLVTGGAGFIGSTLCDRLLAEGKRVVAVDNLSVGRIANLAEARGYGQQFTFYDIDIRSDGLGMVFRRHADLDFTALALGNVYGPRQDPHGEAGVIAIFSSRMLAGETPTIFGTGDQTRDYVFVDDVVHGFSLAAERGSGHLINIGTGVEASVNELYQTLSDLTRFGLEPEFGPLREGEVLRSCLSIELAEAELGWKPWTHLEDGLAETVAWFREGMRGR